MERRVVYIYCQQHQFVHRLHYLCTYFPIYVTQWGRGRDGGWMEWKGNDMESLKNDFDNAENGKKAMPRHALWFNFNPSPHNVVIHRIFLRINIQTPDWWKQNTVHMARREFYELFDLILIWWECDLNEIKLDTINRTAKWPNYVIIVSDYANEVISLRTQYIIFPWCSIIV